MSTNIADTQVKPKGTAPKCVIKDSIRRQLMTDENTMALAKHKKIGIPFHTARTQLTRVSAVLCQPHYLEVIREILELPADAVIYDIIYPETHLFE